MRKVAAALVGLVLLAGLFSLPAPAKAQEVGGLRGWIVFTSDRDGDYEIYKRRADGTGATTQLTQNNVMDYQPRWGPGGKRIVFMRRSSADIYTMWADGSHQRRVVDQATDDWDPAWSPDGRFISWSPYDDGAEIVGLRRKAGGTTTLAHEEENVVLTHSTWSPDSKRLAFVYDGYQIAVRELCCQTINEYNFILTSETRYPERLRWSADGARILYDGVPDLAGNRDLFLIAPDGSSEQALDTGVLDAKAGAWSPSGNKIVFYSGEPGDYDIYVFDLATGKSTPLITSSFDDLHPDWISK